MNRQAPSFDHQPSTVNHLAEKLGRTWAELEPLLSVRAYGPLCMLAARLCSVMAVVFLEHWSG